MYLSLTPRVRHVGHWTEQNDQRSKCECETLATSVRRDPLFLLNRTNLAAERSWSDQPPPCHTSQRSRANKQSENSRREKCLLFSTEGFMFVAKGKPQPLAARQTRETRKAARWEERKRYVTVGGGCLWGTSAGWEALIVIFFVSSYLSLRHWELSVTFH